MGSDAERCKRRVDNAYVFCVMATARGLGKLVQPAE
jgi:hypothetical protein